jgi:hypothetical protein
MTDTEADKHAVAIYAVMARDASDALDMIIECESVRTLETLHAMLTRRGGPNTDNELNEIMAGPTKRRLDALKGAANGPG